MRFMHGTRVWLPRLRPVWAAVWAIVSVGGCDCGPSPSQAPVTIQLSSPSIVFGQLHFSDLPPPDATVEVSTTGRSTLIISGVEWKSGSFAPSGSTVFTLLEPLQFPLTLTSSSKPLQITVRFDPGMVPNDYSATLVLHTNVTPIHDVEINVSGSLLDCRAGWALCASDGNKCHDLNDDKHCGGCEKSACMVNESCKADASGVFACQPKCDHDKLKSQTCVGTGFMQVCGLVMKPENPPVGCEGEPIDCGSGMCGGGASNWTCGTDAATLNFCVCTATVKCPANDACAYFPDDGCGMPKSCGNCLTGARIDTVAAEGAAGDLTVTVRGFEPVTYQGCDNIHKNCAVGGITSAGGTNP
jgi:hypothetical protein